MDLSQSDRSALNTKQFAVVIFLKTNTVDVVPTNWIQTINKAVYCYWPKPENNVTKKIKKREIPDQERWTKDKIKILKLTDTYTKARAKVNEALVTSNLESDQEEEISRRKIVAPVRYQDSDTEIDQPVAKRVKRTISVPQMPTMPSFNPSLDLFSAGDDENSSTYPTGTSSFNALQSSGQGPSLTSTPIVGPSPISTSKTTPSDQNDSCIPPYVRSIFMRLDKIEDSLATIKTILMKDGRSADPEIEELTSPLKTAAALEAVCDKLNDAAHRKKVVDYLSLLGGTTPGDSVRRIMRRIGTNALWANYSLKGRKGKRKFQDLAIYPVIVKACQKNHSKTLQKTIESCISDTLRYAPHRRTQVDDASGPSMTEDNNAGGLITENEAELDGSRTPTLYSDFSFFQITLL
ncbi:uncharacterized protein LOC117825766 isoform X2 [Notolabrus celidotus]|uniref:uncharacterized protein LOC117825766 isoform X2 n=1 Tax=Notolabrus celidotus TaxID=1203425 RepID=UPI00148F54EE|nr:uncharacterized protein LOC117825766 isoform X2 [Notolabrus celidotus]